jgi:flagellar biosynthesis/type III secretory pathway ATPase
MQTYLDAVRQAQFMRRTGRVTHVSGHSMESAGPVAVVGEVCEVITDHCGTNQA